MDGTFAAQYKHPLWQKKRLEALSGSGFECQNCGSKDDQLHVHHKSYVKGRNVWDYGLHELFVLCDKCHERIHKQNSDLKQLLSSDTDIDPILSIVAGYMNASGYEGVTKDICGESPILYLAAGLAYDLYALNADPHFIMDLQKNLAALYNRWRSGTDA